MRNKIICIILCSLILSACSSKNNNSEIQQVDTVTQNKTLEFSRTQAKQDEDSNIKTDDKMPVEENNTNENVEQENKEYLDIEYNERECTEEEKEKYTKAFTELYNNDFIMKDGESEFGFTDDSSLSYIAVKLKNKILYDSYWTKDATYYRVLNVDKNEYEYYVTNNQNTSFKSNDDLDFSNIKYIGSVNLGNDNYDIITYDDYYYFFFDDTQIYGYTTDLNFCTKDTINHIEYWDANIPDDYIKKSVETDNITSVLTEVLDNVGYFANKEKQENITFDDIELNMSNAIDDFTIDNTVHEDIIANHGLVINSIDGFTEIPRVIDDATLNIINRLYDDENERNEHIKEYEDDLKELIEYKINYSYITVKYEEEFYDGELNDELAYEILVDSNDAFDKYFKVKDNLIYGAYRYYPGYEQYEIRIIQDIGLDKLVEISLTIPDNADIIDMMSKVILNPDKCKEYTGYNNKEQDDTNEDNIEQ